MQECMESELGRVAIAGSGFLADGYDLYVIGQVEHVLYEKLVCKGGHVYDCVQDDDFKGLLGMVSSAALWGAVAGQLIFGALADRLGRKKIFVITGSLIIMGSLLSACIQGIKDRPRYIFYQLVVTRALLGFGIGGEYPLSATICAEGTHPARRGTLMALVFSNQGLGYLLSASLMVILAYAKVSLDFMWRFPLAFGAFVPCVSLYFRMMMHESDDFEKVKAARQSGEKSVDMALTIRRYAWHLLGTAGNWFIFDIVFYANSLFNSDVTSIIDVGPGGLKSSFLRTLIIVLIMLPGYFVGVALINRLGRKNVQIQGYVNMIIWFSVAGIFYAALKDDYPGLFIIIYGLTFFFSNFGPNLSTYVIPGEIYPSQAKATLHGLSAASGKVGAAIGSMCMPYITGSPPTDHGIRSAMFVCAALAAGGLLLTFFVTPRYEPEDLAPQEEGETVGFVPLLHQRPASMKQWAQKGSSDDEDSDSDAAASFSGEE